MTIALAIRAGLRAAVLVFAGLAAGVGAAAAQTFQLSGVIFDRSDYLSEAELQAAVAPYLNRDIRFADVEAMLEAVQALYLRRGIVTAQPIIEPQDVADGRLRLTLVEATVESVAVEGAVTTRPDFVLDRLSLEPGAKPDFEALARDLRLIGLSTDLSPGLRFAPGAAPATAGATIVLDEPERVTWVASYDNFAVDDLDRDQVSLGVTWRSVTGVRDTLSARLALTDGSTGLAVSYRRPVGLRGGALTFAASASDSEIVRGEFAFLDIGSKNRSLTLAYDQPFAVRPDRSWTGRVAANYEGSDSDIAGTRFQSSDLREIDASVRHQRQGDGVAWGFALGVKIGTAESGTGALTDGGYALAYGSGSYARRMGAHLVLDAAADWQLAPGANLSVRRRIAAGGSAVLRGYPQDVRTGDSGVTGRLQVSCPAPCLWGTPEDAPDDAPPSLAERIGLAPFAFLDVASIRSFEAAGARGDRSDTLASVGLGARMAMGDAALLGYVGVPLVRRDRLPDRGGRLYVGVDYEF